MTALTGLLIIVAVLFVYVALCFVHDTWGFSRLRRTKHKATN